MWNIIALLSLVFLSPTLSEFYSMQVTTMEGQPNGTDFDMAPFVKIDQKYYYIESKNTHTWFDAVHLCRGFNAHLSFIESGSELYAISNYLKTKFKEDVQGFWISGNDLAEENSFYSIATGQPLSFTHWSENQPDHKEGTEHCVHLWLRDNSYKMNVRNCDNAAYYICQLSNPRSIFVTVW